MKIRSAKISDVRSICSLINFYAERDEMLFRSMADIYENLQTFFVAETAEGIVGCCSLGVIWSDLAEIKSLAVDKSGNGKGCGSALVNAAISAAEQLGLQRIFALTLVPGFFEKLGFEKIDKDKLPMKIWSDCAACPKQDCCDEVAVIKDITSNKGNTIFLRAVRPIEPARLKGFGQECCQRVAFRAAQAVRLPDICQ